MAKSFHNDVPDAALGVVASSNALHVCSAEPTTRTEAVTTFSLANGGLDSGDFAIADGDTSGRKVTVAEQPDLSIGTTGTATHIALVDGTRLIKVTTCPSQALTQGGTVTVGAWKMEIQDPS